MPRLTARAGMAAVAGLELLGLGLYASTLRYGPVWDDHHFVFEQGFLMRCASLARVLDPRTLYRILPEPNSARPVWLASVVADACLSGANVAGFRLTSIFWHAAGAACLMALAWALSRDRRAALAAGLLFVCHPVHTEAVNIVAFRGELLAFVFAALSVLFYVEARRAAGRRRGLLLGASALLYALGLLSKETAAALPLLLVLADALYPARARGRPWTRYAAYLAVFALYLGFRTPRSGYLMEGGREDVFTELRESAPEVVGSLSEQPALPPPRPPKLEPPPWSEELFANPLTRFLTMSRVFGSYARLLVWPHPLQGDYAPRPVVSLGEPRLWLSWAAWLASLAAALALRRRVPLASFGLAWALVMLLPVSGLVALKNLEAERYLYIPSAGACLAAGAALAALSRGGERRARLADAALASVALAFMALTVARNRDYRSDLAFYKATIDVDPDVPRARFNLAQAYIYDGRPDLAEAQYEAGLRLWPRALKGRVAYARLLAQTGRVARAKEVLRETAADYPRSPVLARELDSPLYRRR